MRVKRLGGRIRLRVEIPTWTTAVALVLILSQSQARAATVPYPANDPAPKGRKIIESTWPASLVKAALDVAWCESRMNGDAKNGKYSGIFQMGPVEFTTSRHPAYGNIFDRRANSIAAYNLYLLRGWSAWSCRPVVANAKRSKRKKEQTN